MSFYIYNSLKQKKELFQPIHPPQVKMYVCGPTVYDFLHIGNFRGAVVFNTLRQWLEYRGYKVTYVYNFTDVDDKILNRAKKENTSMKAISEKYITEFKKDFLSLRLKAHDHNPKATEFISEMIILIQDLLKNNIAYVIGGDVFYHVSRFSEYGKLSKKKGEDLLSGARVQVDDRKKDPRDFHLWKSAPKEEMGWESPWGYGRPGWHLECTCMIFSLLGPQIDIHGGGMDLLFPHHENEIAQAEGVKKGPFVKYWMHNNMFTFGGEKMSKSLGNVRLMRSFLEEQDGEIFKFMTLSSHYRSMIEISPKKILQCTQSLIRIYQFLKSVVNLNPHSDKLLPNKVKQKLEQEKQKIEKAFDDDLNTPVALASLFSLIRYFNEQNCNKQKESKRSSQYLESLAVSIKDIILKYGKVMSLFQEDPEALLKRIDQIFIKKHSIDIKKAEGLIKQRALARQNKNFKRADQIREELLQMNIEVKDTSTETKWSVLKI